MEWEHKMPVGPISWESFCRYCERYPRMQWHCKLRTWLDSMASTSDKESDKKGMFELFKPGFCEALLPSTILKFLTLCCNTRRWISVSFRSIKLCTKSRKCSKQDSHHGRCDSKRTVKLFWNHSPIQISHSIKREAKDVAAAVKEECERKKSHTDEKEARVNVREFELVEKEKQIQGVEEKATTARLETGLNPSLIHCGCYTS